MAAVELALQQTVEEMGLSKLKPEQTEAILTIVSGKDVFVSLPTGYGKSIIYGILPLLFDKLKGKILRGYSGDSHRIDFFYIGCKGSIVVCISPLTAIMMDQKSNFAPKGVDANFVGEAQEDPTTIANVLQGKVQLLFISPELILNNRSYRNMLLSDVYKKNLVALVVDEAHCVKTW